MDVSGNCADNGFHDVSTVPPEGRRHVQPCHDGTATPRLVVATSRCRLLMLWSHGTQLYLADSWSRPQGDQTIWAMSPDAVRLLQRHHRTVFTLDARASLASWICRQFIGNHPSTALGDDQVGINMLTPGPHMDNLLQQCVWILPPQRTTGKTLVRLQQAQAPAVYLAVMNPTINLPELSEILRFLMKPPSVTSSYDGLFCPLWSPDHARLVCRDGILVVFPLSFVSPNIQARTSRCTTSSPRNGRSTIV